MFNNLEAVGLEDGWVVWSVKDGPHYRCHEHRFVGEKVLYVPNNLPVIRLGEV